MAVAWEIDPTSEDAANVPLSLTTAPLRLLAEDAMDLTPPDIDAIYASSADTEGDPYVGSRHRNRTITLNLLAKDSTDALTQTAIYGVQQKVSKLRREGGTLKYTTMAGTEIVFDVVKVAFKPQFTQEHYALNKAVPFSLEFECKPYGRGAPVLLSDHTETTLPCLVFTDSGLAGDVPGLGKLVIDEDQGVDQWWAVWGLQSRYYDSATSAALFYEAEGRTALGGSATAAGPTGASGGGSNVMRNTALLTSYQAILSTQAASAGAHLSHVGDFRVFARMQIPTTNTGTVTVALQWSEGDFLRYTTNASYTIDSAREGTWVLVDLGYVHLTKVAQGTQRWEGRILAKSTVVGDDIDVDYLFLVPTLEGSGETSALFRVPTPTTYSARDEFDQTAGALTGKTAPTGGVWAGAGDADDFSVETTGKTAQRTALSDTNLDSGRFAISGVSAFASQLVKIDAKHNLSGVNDEIRLGVVARYTDTSNFALFSAYDGIAVSFTRKVAGVETLMWATIDPNLASILQNTFYTFQVFIDAAGRWAVWLYQAGSTTATPLATGSDAVFATGGALATGKPGFYDATTNSSAVTRNYDNFLAYSPPSDAAIFASQSLEVRSDRVIREDSGGTLWQPPSKYEGDYPRVPPAGKEARTVRVIVKASRNDPASGADSGIDDISARWTYTPRYLVLPS